MKSRLHTSAGPVESLCHQCRGEVVHTVKTENRRESQRISEYKLMEDVCWILLDLVGEIVGAALIG